MSDKLDKTEIMPGEQNNNWN